MWSAGALIWSDRPALHGCPSLWSGSVAGRFLRAQRGSVNLKVAVRASGTRVGDRPVTPTARANR